jgi:hypothetical protein
MIRDPFYLQIVEALGKRLDPEIFERCAQTVLREPFPTLAPVQGGSDDGMDGAIAEGNVPPLPLVCTTAKTVKANLVKNLKSYGSR